MSESITTSVPPPTPADVAAAHQLLCELRTRIATQRLPYQHGVEVRALESLREIFDHAREAMKTNVGCSIFARRTTEILNTVLRPLTAKWHRALVDGRLASKDGADELRGDLEQVRVQLRKFAKELHEMAYRTPAEDAETPPALSDEELRECLKDLEFGIPTGRADVAFDPQTPVRNEEPQAQGPSPDAVPVSINVSEAAAVTARRVALHRPAATGKNAVGLALSGGGIRSATFCLGAVQVLAERRLIEDVDFLSTVSGGGYTGSFLTVELSSDNKLSAEKTAADLVGTPAGPDPVPVARLRTNAKYLTSANLWETWSKVTATVAGMLLNWTAPLFVVFLAAFGAAAIYPAGTSDGAWQSVLFGLGIALGVVLLLYGGLTRGGPRASLFGGRALAAIAGITAVVSALRLVLAGHQELPQWLAGHWPASGAIAALIGAGPAVIRFVPVFRKPSVRVVALKLLLVIAALIIPVLGLAGFYRAWDLGITKAVSIPAMGDVSGLWILGAVTSGLAIVAGFVININLTGPHRLYRDSLARTFLGTEDPLLQDVNTTHRAPYHLINATVNLPTSRLISIRDRKGDFFLFSKAWCGSIATGYHQTDRWTVGRGTVDLKTAMAISGAAASSHMGLASMPALTALITFLNVRLGFWLANPTRVGRWSRWPGFMCLVREMLGIGMSERSAWLNLSDGGHIENTGCYELLRRRCKFIIAIDGEADAAFSFGGLMTVIRHAQIDFGIHIDPRLNELAPNAETGYSQRHTTLCRVQYPATADGRPAATGLLLYLKLSVTGNESELIKRYRAKHPDFPHQSTLDQFFDQEQFEAYRQLGVHVANGLFSPAVLDPGPQPPAGDNAPAAGAAPQAVPATIAEWFERLARNVLDPKRP